MKTLLIIISIISFLAILFYYFDLWMGSKTKNKNLSVPNTDEKSILTISILISSFILFLLVAVTYSEILDDLKQNHPDYSKIGAYGDYIGGTINPVIAFIAVIATGCAFFVQYKANIEIKKQFSIQQEKDYEQNFQNQLFKLMDFHHSIIDNIDVDISTLDINKMEYILRNFPYDYLEIQQNNYLFKILSKKDVILKGRHSFKFCCEIIEECIKLIDLIKKENKKATHTTNINLVYHINKIKELDKFIDNNFDKHKLKMGNRSRLDYLPSLINLIFSQYQLTHYFTNLNRALKIISISNFSKKTEEKKYYYASIVRAQLCEHELKLIFLNGIIMGADYKNYLQQYTLLKHVEKTNKLFLDYSSNFDEKVFSRK
ncbi:MAG: putative phage abortive infection protein [Clostridia bacterium]